jgi:hypothetical protein
MKKLLILLFSILISFNSYGGYFDNICDEDPTLNATVISGTIAFTILVYDIGAQRITDFSGENLCKWNNGKGQWNNGNTRIKGQYINGKREGKWTWHYENGLKMDDGPKSQEGNYKDGNKDGKWTEWDEDGQIISESNWKDGECISGDC